MPHGLRLAWWVRPLPPMVFILSTSAVEPFLAPAAAGVFRGGPLAAVQPCLWRITHECHMDCVWHGGCGPCRLWLLPQAQVPWGALAPAPAGGGWRIFVPRRWGMTSRARGCVCPPRRGRDPAAAPPEISKLSRKRAIFLGKGPQAAAKASRSPYSIY